MMPFCPDLFFTICYAIGLLTYEVSRYTKWEAIGVGQRVVYSSVNKTGSNTYETSIANNGMG
jgi:hypothetical protein